MKRLIIGTLLMAVVSFPAMANVVMLNFHSPTCPHCIQFEKEIGKTRFDTNNLMMKMGITMLVLDFDKPAPKWIIVQYGEEGSIKPIPGTPTFELYDTKTFKSLGRFSGYGSAERFWAETHKLLRRNGMME